MGHCGLLPGVLRRRLPCDVDMMKKKIAVNLLSFDTPALTGVGNFFKRLFEALPPLPDIEFWLFCQRGFPLEKLIKIPSGVKVVRLDVPKFSSKTARVIYEQYVLPFRCRDMDILYSPYVGNPLWGVRGRMVTTIYDLTPFFVRRKYGFIQGVYVRTITRLLARCSNQIITTSQSSKEDLKRVLGVPDSRIHVVYASVPRREVSCIRYDPFFLTVGTRQPAKNLDGVIRAFARFAKQYDTENHRLVVAGGGSRGDDIYVKLTDTLGIRDRVEFLGYVSDPVLNDLYARCKGHIILSFYEGFGIPVVEALSWLKPSVASNVSSLPEVMGSTGILVNPTDCDEAAKAIKALADSPRDFLTGAEQQLRKFSAENQTAAFLRALRLSKE
jgi:glycosyltransferase involved in cell wall biosynthesis